MVSTKPEDYSNARLSPLLLETGRGWGQEKDTHHLFLFFDEQWQPKSDIVSYGHDIEAAWLLQEAAEVIGDEELSKKVKEQSVQMANAVIKGLDKDGGLWYEYDKADNHLIKEKHWWPQSEAMVGFINAWQNTGSDAFLHLYLNNWRFTQRYAG